MSPEFKEYLLKRRQAILMECSWIEHELGIEDKSTGLKKRVEELERQQRILPRAQIQQLAR